MKKNKVIIIAVTLVLCFSIIAIAHFQYFETRSKILELYGEKQVILAKQIALSLRKYFEDQIRSLKILAALYGKGNLHRLNLNERLDYFLDRNIYDEEILFINSGYNVDYHLTRRDIHTNPTEVPPEFVGKSFKYEQISGQKTGATIRLVRSRDVKDSKVLISVPAFDRNNDYRGLVIEIINLNKILKEIITPFMDTYGAHAFLLSDSSEILYHPYHPERTFKKFNNPSRSCKKCHQNFLLEKRMLKLESGWGTKEDYGDKKLLSFAKIQLANISWITAVKTPYDEIARANRRQFWIFFFLSASMMLFVLLGSMAFYKIAKKHIELEKEKQLRHQEHLAFIGEMSTRIAHEIKNPLASLQTGIQLVESTLEMDEETHEYFKRLTGEIHRVDEIVKGLLAYARDEQIKRIKTDLTALVQNVIRLIQPTIKDKSIEWKLSIPSSRIMLMADEQKMEQVLWNLIINAVQAVKDSGQIEIILQKEKNKKIHIKIIDNGCGISGKNLSKIFQPFFSTQSQGTGLGLAISKKIIQAHGGRIRVESKVGHGTCVEIILTGV